MIRQYVITNFKSIGEGKIELSSLNLFSGPNSAGKTSAIQALLSAIDNTRNIEGVHPIVSRHLLPTTFNEVRNYLMNAKSYTVSLRDEDNIVSLIFTPADDAMIKTSVRQKGVPNANLLDLAKGSVFYLPAMRTAKLDETTINTNPDRTSIGLNAEFIIDYFQNHHSDLLEDDLLSVETKTLDAQVNFWLQRLTGYSMNIAFDGSKYVVRFIGKGGKELMPCHVGTGVSYIAQVVMVCMATTRNSLIIVENPEIHLHPSAQATMIDFLTMISKTGRQIIVESHSDHIFNGIRRLLHSNIINTKEVNVTNFTQDDFGITHASTIQFNQNGGLLKYTPGLFDQFDDDLDSILR